MENLVFTLPSFVNQGLGLTLNRPELRHLRPLVHLPVPGRLRDRVPSSSSTSDDRPPGLALNAARWSEAGARTSGISVVQMKVIAGALAALIAGIGGALLAMAQTTFQPSEFATFAGVVWLAVLVTIGVRSNAAALIAGRHVRLPRALIQYYLLDVDLAAQRAAGALRSRRDLGRQVPRRRAGREEPAAAAAGPAPRPTRPGAGAARRGPSSTAGRRRADDGAPRVAEHVS